MKKLDARTLKSLCNLEQNEDFRVIQEWFLDSLADDNKVLCEAESSVQVYRAQGSIRNLKAFCEAAAAPRDMAGKLRMQKAGIRNIP
jgi:hypothetical protein